VKDKEEALANQNLSRVQELRAAIVTAILTHGPPPALLKPDERCALYYLKIQAYEKMKLYSVALIMYSSFGLFCNNNQFAKEQNWYRKFLVNHGKGRYYYELKEYEDCIMATNVAIYINCLEPQVHYYKALSQQKLN
jgi:tetratricopeptide (TPR) repeat protein